MQSEIAKAHKKNLDALLKATTQVNRALNQAIKNNDDLNERIYIRILVMLWMTWAECKLNSLLTLSQVTKEDREYIEKNSKNEHDRWRLLFDYFFRHRYLGNNWNRSIDGINLGRTTFYRYQAVIDLIDNKVALFIEIRNRLAHGQWHIALNYDLSAQNPQLTQTLWRLTKTDVLILKRLLIVLSSIISDLISSKSAFEKNFDQRLRTLDLATSQFEGRMEQLRDFLFSRRYKRAISSYDEHEADTG